MRNVISVISGILVSFITAAMIAFIILKFDIIPITDFARGNFSCSDFTSMLQKTRLLHITMLFPFLSLATGITAGITAGIIAKNKEYLLGFLSAIPMLSLFFELSIDYFLILLRVSLYIFVGVYFAKYVKSKMTKEGK